MKISEKIAKFQDGGPMPAEAQPADPNAGGGDPQAQLLAVAQQALETQNCEAAMAVCEGLLQMASGGAAGPPQEGQPVYKAGGKLFRRIKN